MDWLTLDEVASQLGIAKKTLSNRVYAKQVPVTRLAIGGIRVHRLVFAGIRAGLSRDDLHHIAVLCRRYADPSELHRVVHAYIAARTANAPRGAA